MTPREKRPTSQPPLVPARARMPRDSQQDVPTEIYDPTRLERPSKAPSANAPAPQAPPPPQFQAISMKTPSADKLAVDMMRAEPLLKRPKLRAMAEVRQTPPGGTQSLGHFAPPRDAAQVRARRRGELLVLGSLSVMIAAVVALAIWFIAR